MDNIAAAVAAAAKTTSAVGNWTAEKTYVALQGALEDELLSHLAVPFWLIRGGSMGEWGGELFQTVPLAREVRNRQRHNAETGDGTKVEFAEIFVRRKIGSAESACHSCQCCHCCGGRWFVVWWGSLWGPGLLPPWRCPPLFVAAARKWLVAKLELHAAPRPAGKAVSSCHCRAGKSWQPQV